MTTKVSYKQAHGISVHLMMALEDKYPDAGTDLLVAGLALTLGRLTSPMVLAEDEEVPFVKSCTEWISLYFMPTVGMH